MGNKNEKDGTGKVGNGDSGTQKGIDDAKVDVIIMDEVREMTDIILSDELKAEIDFHQKKNQAHRYIFHPSLCRTFKELMELMDLCGFQFGIVLSNDEFGMEIPEHIKRTCVRREAPLFNENGDVVGWQKETHTDQNEVKEVKPV